MEQTQQDGSSDNTNKTIKQQDKGHTTKSVKIADNEGKDKPSRSQQSLDKFVKTPLGQNKPDPRNRTPPTPPEKLQDRSNENKGQKKQKTGSR